MLYTPKKTKYKKQQKKLNFNKLTKSTPFENLNFYSIKLKSISSGYLNSKQLEMLRQTIVKTIKKSGRVFINVFPNTPITKKPLEVRMGKGKGNVDHWASKIQNGTCICTIEINSKVVAIKALINCQKKLPLKTRIVYF